MVAEGDFSLEDLKKEYGADYFHGREYVDYVADEPVQCAAQHRDTSSCVDRERLVALDDLVPVL